MSNNQNFNFQLPNHFDFEKCLQYFSRSEKELCNVVDNSCLFKLYRFEDELYLVKTFKSKTQDQLCNEVLNHKINERARSYLLHNIQTIFDLGTDLDHFYKSISSTDPAFSIIQKHKGLRLIKEYNLFEALTWAIIGQQINLEFAYTVKGNFISNWGKSLTWKGKSYWIYPEAQIIQDIKDEDFKLMKFSKQKARYIREVAEYCLAHPSAKNDLQRLSFEEAQKELMTIKGVGSWTANYVLMRCLSFNNALPAKDVALQQAFKQIYGLASKPTAEALRQMTKHWNGWESYWTFYLWHYLSKG